MCDQAVILLYGCCTQGDSGYCNIHTRYTMHYGCMLPFPPGFLHPSPTRPPPLTHRRKRDITLANVDDPELGYTALFGEAAFGLESRDHPQVGRVHAHAYPSMHAFRASMYIHVHTASLDAFTPLHPHCCTHCEMHTHVSIGNIAYQYYTPTTDHGRHVCGVCSTRSILPARLYRSTG